MKNQVVSTIAFVGAFGVIALIVFNQIPISKGLLIGGGLAAVGLITQPSTSEA